MKTECTSPLTPAHRSLGEGGFLNPCALIGFALYAAGLALAFGPVSSAAAGDNAAAELNQSVPAQAPGHWRVTGDLVTARYGHTATLLPNRQVLVAGGLYFLASAELYDPTTGVWTATGSMTTVRVSHTATLLPNGRVLVAGGDFQWPYSANAELYDPATGMWRATGSMTTIRVSHTATLLPNGRVLVAGGYWDALLASAELYDPATRVWTATGSMATVRWGHTATLLPNGQVLVAGGRGRNNPPDSLASAELYDPASGMWTVTGSMATGRWQHTATLLPNGQVLVAGGLNRHHGYLASAELYDPATGVWTATGDLASARELHTATLLPNGQVLVAGGDVSPLVAGGDVSRDPYRPTPTAELYDPATGSWTATASLRPPRRSHTATLLRNGRVLVSGGYNFGDYGGLASAELYQSAPEGLDIQ